MLLLDIEPQQSVMLKVNQPMVLWIGTHETTDTKGSKHTIFSPIEISANSEICINGKRESLWRNGGSGWFQARLYNVAVNPNRYSATHPNNELLILWRILPFQHCIFQGVFSAEKPKKSGHLKAGKTLLLPADEYQRLEESADLLSTPYAPQELQWLKQPICS